MSYLAGRDLLQILKCYVMRYRRILV
ncbi:hypothetical protein LINGRAHAP2_LOCUS7287 [Linum grandiflorum]